ncbi:MAG TPA: beta-ketoacyl synthase N-terminal-like domain-containing protein [Bacteroidota bacterium]|nr:beta-ketoacyl synthase N-terminal-like domain-containing protein [Bacteroidota bacterium]
MNDRKLGRGVALVGAGMSRFGAFPGKSTRDLLAEAYRDMIASVDRGLDPNDIDGLYIGNFSSELFEGQGHTAPIMADWLGLAHRPATRVEDACASGGAALREGVIAIASGIYDVALVGGIEKMTNLSIQRVTDALATAGDELFEIPSGFTFPAFYATMATAYLARYEAAKGKSGTDALLAVGMKNHENGKLNPKAHFAMSICDVIESKKAAAAKKGNLVPTWSTEIDFLMDERANPMVAWPLRLFDCSPVSDGAACLLLVREDLASSFTNAPLHIIGTGQASDGPLHSRTDITTMSSARAAAQQAYTLARVDPADISVAEVHDCFTIAEIIATEDLGFFERGKGGTAAIEGRTALHGTRPVNTSGGLKSKGHPVGATGAAQVVEIWKQLRGEAGPRQAQGALHLGLTHNTGGTGQTTIVHIFERRT